MDRIPVYVMTGFLGSGKSHRLNDILAQRRYRKCLVILSEKGRTDVSTEDKIVLDASSLSDEELVEKAGRIIRDHWIGEIWWEWNGMRPFSDWEHLIYETHLSRLMEPKRVYFSADENFVNFFLGKTGTAILTQLESADEILFFANDEKGKGVKKAGKKLSAWNPSASFRIVTPKSAGNLYVRSGRFTDHFKGLWQRRLDIFILLWSFLFLAAALLTREENLLRISLLAVGITLQTLPFVLIGVLLSTGMQLYSSRPPWEIYLRKHPVLSVPLALIGGFFFPFCDCALTPLFRGFCKRGVPVAITMIFLMAGPLTNPVVLVSTWYAFGGDLSMVGGRLLLGWLNAVLVGATFAFYKKNPLKAFSGPQGTEELIPSEKDSKASLFLLHSRYEFWYTFRYVIMGAWLAAIFQVSIRPILEGAGLTSGVSSVLCMMLIAFCLSLCATSDAMIGKSLSLSMAPSSVMGFLLLGPVMDLRNVLLMSSMCRKSFVIRWALVTILTTFACSMLFVFLKGGV